LETAAAIADSALHHESRIVQAAALSALFSLPKPSRSCSTAP
jgi:hypothetical protein